MSIGRHADFWLSVTLLLGLLSAVDGSASGQVYPGKEWAAKEPDEVGLDVAKLKQMAEYAGGSGCVVRDGYMVYTWGDPAGRQDVASAAKPIYAHFLFKAIEQGKIGSLDEPVVKWEPRLGQINAELGHKDKQITWRHLANQISCYGLKEQPGTAFAYNDWQMALFWDLLFTKVWGASYESVDAEVLHPGLTDLLGCQDNPTFMAFGTGDRPGRTGISPRDFARFGLLYLRGGRWKDKQLIERELVRMAVTSPLANAIPRAGNEAAEMIPGQRSIGSRSIPDNQCDHIGSYSWLWWINGVDRDGKRHWPDVPADAYGCFGHGGMRAVVMIPRLGLIVSWNDTKIEGRDMENHALGLLVQAVHARQDADAKQRLSAGAKDFGSRAALTWEPVEWAVDGVSHSGNPFDVEATVTVWRGKGAYERKTQMFYDGDNTWKFRFAPTVFGPWTFLTESDVPALDGCKGTVTVERQPDPRIEGFLRYSRNKYEVQTTHESIRRAYLFNVYMNRRRFPAMLDEFGSDIDKVVATAKAYLEDARANGFEVIFIHVNNNWFKFGAKKYSEHDSVNPDPVTFRVLEAIITTVHRAGGRVHIWAWGDESREWTPIGVPGGVNGPADRRLQRYIAARLGPLPGWTMGYGFDLHEWLKPGQLGDWADYLHKHLAWEHLLCARGYRLGGQHNLLSYDGFGRDVALATTSHGPVDYAEIVEDLTADATRAHLYEERHSYKRDGFNLDMDGTRRLLWWETMAGGMGGFFGFYPDSPHPYPNPEQLQTHYTFWHTVGRFQLDMKPANDVTEGGYVLASPSTDSLVLYAQDASQIRLNLVDMERTARSDSRYLLATLASSSPEGELPAVAVDTKKPYREIPVGMLGPKQHTWNAPYTSDWAVAVGDFRRPRLRARASRSTDRPKGLIIVDPDHPQWLKRDSGEPFFMCGPGDPEDFLYRGTPNPDGTRNGDQMALIEKLRVTGANCIYLMAVRSHGGDGDKTHNPFIDHDPAKGINSKVLDQWERWFTAMDEAGIVIYFFLYDDSALVWETGDHVGPQELTFIRAIVDRFEHHDNLIWCIAEEYAERLSALRVKHIAAEIRKADDRDHVIAVHKNHGLDFSEFADDPHIDQFAVQYNVPTAQELHRGMVRAWADAKGRFNLNMSEAADFGTGRELRNKIWACAMGGAYVMILEMDIAHTPWSDLEDCGRLVRFFESTNFHEMSPRDDLACGGTEYVLAKPDRSYIAYASYLQGKMGLRDFSNGTCKVLWFDCETGARAGGVWLRGGPGRADAFWSKPAQFSDQCALYVNRVD